MGASIKGVGVDLALCGNPGVCLCPVGPQNN
jgi:hypothetical protein